MLLPVTSIILINAIVCSAGPGSLNSGKQIKKRQVPEIPSSVKQQLQPYQKENLLQFREKDLPRLMSGDSDRQRVSKIVTDYIESKGKNGFERQYYQGFPELALATLQIKGNDMAQSKMYFNRLADAINKDFRRLGNGRTWVEADSRRTRADLALLSEQGLLDSTTFSKSQSMLDDYIEVIASKAPILYVGAATQNELPQIINLYLRKHNLNGGEPRVSDPMRFVRLALLERNLKDKSLLLTPSSISKVSLSTRAKQFESAILKANQRKNFKKYAKIAAFFAIPTAVAVIAISAK